MNKTLLIGAFIVLLAGCKFTIPVDEQMQPTGDQVIVEPSADGSTSAVMVQPDGTETSVDLEVTPDAGEISAAISAGSTFLPPPWNIIIAAGAGLLTAVSRKESD